MNTIEILVELEFSSPILFRVEATQNWRIPSDTLFRGLVSSIVMLYSPTVARDVAENTFTSSLLMIRDSKLYIPNIGIRSYVSLDESDAVDASELLAIQEMMRIPRIPGFDPTPFGYNALLAQKEKWGIVLHALEVLKGVLLSGLKLLGELGIGAKRTRGYGRFRVVRESLLEEYGAKISSKGTLASRYQPLKKETVEGLEIYWEEFEVSFGAGRKYVFSAIGEGSKLLKADRGRVEYVVNDLGHRVPVLLRPVLLTPS